MKVIAIDPGYERVGIAVIEKNTGKEHVLFSECFLTDKALPHAERLFRISERIRATIESYAPDVLAIESLFFATNQKTAIAVAEARGVILAEAARGGILVHEFKPMEIKVAVTGYGKSDKKQVTEMVKRLVRIEKTKALDDEYDAIAIGITCLASLPTRAARYPQNKD